MKSETVLAAVASWVVLTALLKKQKSSSSNIFSGSKPKNFKFDGYQIQDQKIYITDSTKAKKFVFDIGAKEPEGALFKKAFGADQLSYSDVKLQNTYSNTTNIIVKDENQQDALYVLLTYLFTGAYIQSPHRVGHYADMINNFTVYVKKMFNRDLPIIKNVDEAKVFFEEMAKTL